jgi:hypothetical protein
VGDPIKEGRFRQDMKSALERLRNAIVTRVHPREQHQFLDVVDRIQEFVMSRVGDLDQVQSSIQRTKDSTRRTLRSRPVDMVQLLNELDGIEQEIVSFFTQVLKGEGDGGNLGGLG